MTIEHVKELLAKATPGPWRPGDDVFDQVVSEVDGECIVQSDDYYTSMGIGAPDDIPFIAAAPDIARLCIELSEEVERLRGKYEKP